MYLKQMKWVASLAKTKLTPKGASEVWMEVHGRDTQVPTIASAIMNATGHDNDLRNRDGH